MSSHPHNMNRRTVTLIWVAIVLAVLALVAALLVIIGPAPPRIITMATGAEGSAQQVFGEQYRALLATHGVELRLVATGGSVENLQRLNDPASGVSVGFAQAGLTTSAAAPDLLSLGTVFYEQVWVLYRGGLPHHPSDLFKGKRVSIGAEGSGTRKLALELIAALGFDPAGIDFRDMRDQDAASALLMSPVRHWVTPIFRSTALSPCSTS